MDILLEVKDKIAKLPTEIERTGMVSIITHIERAEFYLDSGKKKADINFFTDVIYRSNQAFEGILKEAYKYIAQKEIGRKTIYQIENYFLRNKILNYRVLDLFKNYRQNWRNPSTHDYNLFFSSYEAFLAIISVSSFIYVLLDQISEATAYKREKEELKDQSKGIQLTSDAHVTKGLVDEVFDLLGKFNEVGYDMNVLATESEIIGVLTALFESFSNDVKIVREPLLNKANKNLRPDFLLQRDDESVVLEVKRTYNEKSANYAKRQMLEYLNEIGIANGIIFFPGENKFKYDREISKSDRHTNEKNIYIVREIQ